MTEGKPKSGHTKNPYTRVYSARQLRHLLRKFTDVQLRKNGFRLDNIMVPKGAHIRNIVLHMLGVRESPASEILYGNPSAEDSSLELALSPYLGFGWNISAARS